MAKTLAEYSKEHRQRKRAYLDEIKANSGCVHCGEKDPIVLEFHHLDGDTKHESLKRKQHRRGLWQLSWANLKEEVGKCIVLCANCHRRVEYRKHTSMEE